MVMVEMLWIKAMMKERGMRGGKRGMHNKMNRMKNNLNDDN